MRNNTRRGRNCLENMKNGKCPGTDGFGADFLMLLEANWKFCC